MRNLTSSDWMILNNYKTILPGIALIYGSVCVVSLHAAENASFPCISVVNGEIDDIFIGKPLSNFSADALLDEAYPGGKNTIGIYYAKSHKDHSLKCVINAIRNENGELIGALCISIDVSTPIHKFMREFIPVVDNDLANGISDVSESVPSIDEIISNAINQAIAHVNNEKGLTPVERNRTIVQQLQGTGIFSIRGAVNNVAKALGVSRYSIYNYLKDSRP